MTTANNSNPRRGIHANSFVFDYQDILPSEYIEAFELYLEKCCMSAMESMLLELDCFKHHGIEIDSLELLEFNMQLGTLLLAHPEKLLPLFADAIRNYEKRLLDDHENRDLMAFKPNVHARICNLPSCPEIKKQNVSSLRSKDVGPVVSVPGTVVRTSAMKMLEFEREYVCQKCKHQFRVYADMELKMSTLNPPTQCPSIRTTACKSTAFAVVEGSQVCRDYQEIKIQEQVQKLTVGSIPRSIVVILEDDLVDICKPGDDVVVTGVLTRRWKSLVKDIRADIEIALKANHVKINNEKKNNVQVTDEVREEFIALWRDNRDTPLKARDHLLRSMCPEIYGLFVVKLALALTLVGGVAHHDPSGTRVRGESHMLLIGDPGVGKSQVLKYAAKLAPRAVHTTGIGTTTAGLTVSANRDSGGEWILEAGALVLADGGLCCIDEFDCIREADRTSIHEAMEQQSLSVAKAGLVCKLNTRASVLAATNPKGKFDPDANISVNCALAAPLLSRFDIVLVLLDSRNAEWDRELSTHILTGATIVPERVGPLGPLWDFEKLQNYIAHVRTNFSPRLTEASEKVLKRYYQVQRAADYRNAARTTIRLLESLIRLAQAHARLMFRHEVLVMDAIMAIFIVECSQTTSPVTALPSTLQSSFSNDPDGDYRQMEANLWNSLGLNE